MTSDRKEYFNTKIHQNYMNYKDNDLSHRFHDFFLTAKGLKFNQLPKRKYLIDRHVNHNNIH